MYNVISQIFKEEVYDLLDPNLVTFSKVDGTSLAKPGGPARAPIQIRETANGGITLAGVTEAEVRTKEEMASFLLRGSLCRATGSTNMNSQSRCYSAHFLFDLACKCNLKSSLNLWNRLYIYVFLLDDHFYVCISKEWH